MRHQNGHDRHLASELVHEHMHGRIDRRELLRRAGMLGLSVPVLSAALGAARIQAQEGTPAAENGEMPELGNYEGQTLTISIAMAEAEVTVFNEVVAAGFTELTGGELEVINIEAADVVQTLQAQVDADEVEIDLVVQDNNTLAQLVTDGLVEEIPEAEDVMPEQTIDALLPVLQFDDQYYFLPSRPNVQITYYNSLVFDDLGLEPPTTWDALMSAGEALADNAGVGQLSVQAEPGGPVGVTATQFLWQAGGDPLDLSSAEAAEAYQFMQDLEPYLTPQYPTATFDTTNNYLLDETVMLAQNWPFGVIVIVGEGEKEEILTYTGWEGPAGNQLVLGGDVFGIATGTENREMALDFTRFWMSQEVQEQLTAQIGWASMRDDALETVEDWQQPYFEVVTEAMEYTQARPNIEIWPQVESILGSAFDDIVGNQAPVEETLEGYHAEIEALQEE